MDESWFRKDHLEVYFTKTINSEKHNKEKRIKEIWFSFYF